MVAGRNVITFSPYEVYHITIFSHYSHLVSNRTHRSSQSSGYVLDLLSETISQNSFVMLEVYIHL